MAISLDGGINYWGTTPGNPINAPLAAIDSSLDQLLTTEAKALLAEEERAQQQTALRIWDNHDGTIRRRRGSG